MERKVRHGTCYALGVDKKMIAYILSARSYNSRSQHALFLRVGTPWGSLNPNWSVGFIQRIVILWRHPCGPAPLGHFIGTCCLWAIVATVQFQKALCQALMMAKTCPDPDRSLKLLSDVQG